jgi:hypothetical protein
VDDAVKVKALLKGFSCTAVEFDKFSKKLDSDILG